ncbi:MAG TPA: dienelactone hydrolase family protein [Steroidobacteraceae bacterium]|jgi:phospholipase/carboxylesterase|nr:dienelactone hydrolase family protein [Steroidobacteraceae bacterium]
MTQTTSTSAIQSPVQIDTGSSPSAAVIWLHGLGADGHDFEPIVPDLVARGERALRFIFPHAPVRPVTLNGGLPMRAWYDLLGLHRGAEQDEVGLRTSETRVQGLIRAQQSQGIGASRIVLAGFSQGGAMALYSALRYPERLAGIVGLSCYLPMAETLSSERHLANEATPILLAHGEYDSIVDPAHGEATRTALEAAGYRVEWHSYAMAHAVCREEVAAIAAFLRQVLP